jgi:putative addiction module killer protein
MPIISIEIFQTETGQQPFSDWHKKLRDKIAKARISTRLDQLTEGNFGDSKAFNGIIELRVDIGAGHRVYCATHGKTLVVLLCGGDKSSQQKDIKQAIEFLKDWKKRK